MKILLLTQYFPPEFGAAAARNSEHARLWAEAGHAVQVCTGMPNYPTGQVAAGYRGKVLLRETQSGYEVVRTWIYATPNRAVWKRVLASLSFMASALISGIFCCRRPDIIIASSGPFFVAPLGYLLSLVKRVPFVFEVRDILPQQAVDVGMLKNRFLIRFLTEMEEFLYRRACCIVTVAAASRESLVERGIPSEKVFTVENGIVESFFAPMPGDNAVRDEEGWAGKFVVLYVGAHGVSQGLHALLEVAQRVKEYEDILFVFAGEGAEKPAMMAWAGQHELSNVRFLPLQHKDRMPQLYAAANVCLVPLRKGKYFTINIPSKTFEIMACGRPILLGAQGQARRIVEEAEAGITVDPEDVEGYTQALLSLYNDPARCAALGKAGRAYVLEHFTRRAKAQAYLDILQQYSR